VTRHLRSTTSALVALGLVSLLVGGALAAEEESFARTGGYTGAGFLGAFNETDLDDGIGDSIGFDLRAGYRLHRRLAVEAQLSYFRSIGNQLTVVDRVGRELEAADPTNRLDTLTGTINLKSFLLTGRFQPYVQVGLGGSHVRKKLEYFDVTRVDDSTAAFTFRGGGGIDIYLMPSLLLYTEATYILLTGEFGGDGFVPLVFGVQCRF
jgi:opacity protein-like surface antigen